MIEEGLFSHFLKPLLQKKNEKDVLKKILDEYIKTPYFFITEGLCIRIQKISSPQKMELMLHKEEIEKKLEDLLSKKYTISF